MLFLLFEGVCDCVFDVSGDSYPSGDGVYLFLYFQLYKNINENLTQNILGSKLWLVAVAGSVSHMTNMYGQYINNWPYILLSWYGGL